MIVVHEEITASEATLPLGGGVTTNSLGLHIEDSLAGILRNLYALNGEPLRTEQISLEQNPLVRLQVVSRQVKPISNYIEGGIQKLLQHYTLHERTANDTLVDVIVITGINVEESHLDTKVLELGLSDKGISFDHSSLSTVCWQLINIGILIKVLDKRLLKERLTMYIPNEVIAPSMSGTKEVLNIMREAGVKCSIQQLPLQKIVD